MELGPAILHVCAMAQHLRREEVHLNLAEPDIKHGEHLHYLHCY